jgi:hypothetical protein
VRYRQCRLRERHAHQRFVIHVVTLVAAHHGWKHDAQGVSDQRDWLCVTGPERIRHNPVWLPGRSSSADPRSPSSSTVLAKAQRRFR